MPIAPNTSFDHYEILAPIGKGAMGEVYRACATDQCRAELDGGFEEVRLGTHAPPRAEARRANRWRVKLPLPGVCTRGRVRTQG